MPQPAGEEGAHSPAKVPKKENCNSFLQWYFSLQRALWAGAQAAQDRTPGAGVWLRVLWPPAAEEFSLITGVLGGLESSQQPMEPFLCLSPRG